jgi:hypothetical protein
MSFLKELKVPIFKASETVETDAVLTKKRSIDMNSTTSSRRDGFGKL